MMRWKMIVVHTVAKNRMGGLNLAGMFRPDFYQADPILRIRESRVIPTSLPPSTIDPMRMKHPLPMDVRVEDAISASVKRFQEF
jgi:hypothetical protein